MKFLKSHKLWIGILVLYLIVNGIFFGEKHRWIFIEHPIDVKIFQDENPARQQKKLEEYNTVTFVVDEFGFCSSQNIWTIYGHIPTSNIPICAYLYNKDATQIDLGDTITLTGHLDFKGNLLFVGDSIRSWPLFYPARFSESVLYPITRNVKE